MEQKDENESGVGRKKKKKKNRRIARSYLDSGEDEQRAADRVGGEAQSGSRCTASIPRPARAAVDWSSAGPGAGHHQPDRPGNHLRLRSQVRDEQGCAHEEQAAPRKVNRLTSGRLKSSPVEGTMKAATAEMPNVIEPAC